MAVKKLTEAGQIIVQGEIRQLILQGYRSGDIFTFGFEKYGLSRKQVSIYLKKAKADFLQIDNKTKGQLRNKYRERLEMMYNNALNVAKDIDLALKIQRELNTLISQGDEMSAMPDITVIFKQADDNDDK